MSFWQWLSNLFKQFFSYAEKVEAPPKKDPPLENISPVKLRDLDEGTLAWYREAYKQMQYDPGSEAKIKSAANRVLMGRRRYQYVEGKTRVPWFVIGALHNMESSCDFRGVLHNGQHIIGSGKKTTLVPAGRGPFDTWEESAIDAITLNGSRWSRLRTGSKDVSEILFACERFNGMGYITGAGKDETSPYLWANTTINDGKGKYTADGKFDPSANANGQVGVAAILKQLEIDGHIRLS